MYVVTFYSYKGGVGRTMALVNVAVLLAKSGKRVLAVDFDLEAPGLTSYPPFECARGRPGLIEYVESYRRELVAPEAAEFIVKCPLQDGASIWVMPAGNSADADYAQRFNSIDWDDFYLNADGYLMFEDLKHQWEHFGDTGFDYVLVDSRTGYTDVGGICTRHLPDAVVIMFAPNEQNIEGLGSVVAGIRQEEEFGNSITLHFCASNVPDEYDEEEILDELLADARRRLGFEGGNVVHHRTSIELLRDPVIVTSRPKSKLAKEYRRLGREITAENLADPEGAQNTLRDIIESLELGGDRDGRQLTANAQKLTEIMRLHSGDAEISLRTAEAFRMIGNYEAVVQATTRVVDLGGPMARALLLRGLARMALDDRTVALEDFKQVLTSPDGTTFEFRPAAQLLRVIADDPRPTARELFKDGATKNRARLELAPILMGRGGDFDLVADVLLAELKRNDLDDEQRSNCANAAALALTASGRFVEVVELLREPRGLALQFNRAVAQWGAEGSPPVDAFERIASRIGSSANADANWHQCFALTWAVLGNREEAMAELDLADARVPPSGPIFSCWTYTYGTPDRFRSDLQSMRRQLESRRVPKPPVLSRNEARQVAT